MITGAMYASARSYRPPFELSKICFPEQLAFIKDPEPFVTADCSRRAGKTEVCALDLLETARTRSGCVCLYITLTRSNASKIIWSKIKNLNEAFSLGGTPNESELSLKFPNGSVIYLSGCKDKSELDKFRGLAVALVYIDEVQSFRSFISELIDDVLAPALADYAGKLKLIGTPALLKSGYFWECINSNSYSHHHWTFWQNPFLPALKEGLTHRSILDRELRRRGINEAHPSVQREWFGKWVVDTESLVLHYSPQKNHFDLLPILTDYVIGVDIGHDDSDAIAVIGWHKNLKRAYLVEEFVKPQQGVTELADEIEKRFKRYNPLKIVMDTGGLGKKIAKELQSRFSLPISAAEKSRKIEFLALLDDALRTERFFAHNNSRFAQDTYIVEWDHDKTTPEKKIIKDEPHSDIVDAVLYGFREALHWLSEPAEQKVSTNNKAQWIKHTESLMEKQLEIEIQIQQAQENEDDYFQMAMGEIDPLRYALQKRKGL